MPTPSTKYNTDNNTIQLNVSSGSPYQEYVVAVGDLILPGMLCMIDQATGGRVRPHDNADGFSERLICIENPYKGGDIDTPYLPGDRAMFRLCRAGDEVLLWLGVGICGLGNKLISYGEVEKGQVQRLLVWTGVEEIIGIALEEVIATSPPGSGVYPKRVMVRIT